MHRAHLVALVVGLGGGELCATAINLQAEEGVQHAAAGGPQFPGPAAADEGRSALLLEARASWAACLRTCAA